MGYGITQDELDTCKGPRRGVIAFRDTVMFWCPTVTDVGIYARRPAGRWSRRSRKTTPANASLHAVGRAWDAGVPHADDDPAVGNIIAAALIANWQALGCIEVIWNAHRWTPEDGYQDYHGPDNHKTHVHAGFNKVSADSDSSHDELIKWFSWFMFRIKV